MRVRDISKMLGLLDKFKSLGCKEELEGLRKAVKAAKAGVMQLSFAATGPFLGK